jgi:hypothetical protein
MLATGSDYRELGASYFDRMHQHRTAARLTRRLRDMGFDVIFSPKAA